MARPKIPDEVLASIPEWLYLGVSDTGIAHKLGISESWALSVIERYVAKRGYHSRVQLVLAYVDKMVAANPEHPDLYAAYERINGVLTPQERTVLATLLTVCELPQTPTIPLAARHSGKSNGFFNKHLALARSAEALDTKAHWHTLVTLFYLEQLYLEQIIIGRSGIKRG